MEIVLDWSDGYMSVDRRSDNRPRNQCRLSGCAGAGDAYLESIERE